MIQHCPTPTELDDLELLVSGAYAPLSRFNEPGSVVTLDLPDGATEAELVDPEGLPLARVAADGSLEPLTHAQYGPFRRLHLTPAQVREQHAGATFVPVVDALSDAELEEVRGLGRVVLVALTGTGTADLSPVALVRASLVAAELLGDASVVAVPLPSHENADADHELGVAEGVDDRHEGGAGVLLAHLGGREVEPAEGAVLGVGERLERAVGRHARQRQALRVDQLGLAGAVGEGEGDRAARLVEAGERCVGAGDEELQVVELGRRRAVLDHPRILSEKP